MTHAIRSHGPLLELENVSIGYGSREVVIQVQMTLNHGEIGCLLGPSGCGKTTLLRAIAGFEPPRQGSIRMHGRLLSSASHSVSPEDRRIGMVFQEFALFPHLRVADNIGFGIQRWPKSRQQDRIQQLLSMIGLERFGQRYPHELSGGEQQRVALARAIAPGPELLLLDEPFSSLDIELRQDLAYQTRESLLQERIGAILVTHDQSEAFAMADRVGVMEVGRVHQWDSGYNLYHRPRTRFVADFIGEGEFLPGTVLDSHSVETLLGVLRGANPHGHAHGELVDILVRPDDVLYEETSSLMGKIIRIHFRGSHFLYRVRLHGRQDLYCFADSHHTHNVGDRIGIILNFKHLVTFPRGPGRALI